MKYLQMVMVMTVLISCSGSSSIIEIKDKDLLIQASCKSDRSDPHDQEYRVRIFPELKAGETMDKKLVKQMAYRIDSCFYKVENGDKQYPEIVMAIANGVKNSFEYLVVFSGLPKAGKSNELHYESKYINTKTYRLIFK